MNPKIDSPIKLYFYKFLKGGRKQIQVGDIILTPEYDKYSDIVYWTMNNPNNESYSFWVLKGYVDQMADEFSKLTDSSFNKQITQKLETPTRLHIKASDERKFLKLSQKTSKFNYKEISMDIYPFDIYISADSDSLYFDVSIICYNPYDTKSNTELTYEQLHKKLDYYKEWDGYFDYTDNLFSDLLNYAWDNEPTLLDKTYMMTGCRLRYFTPDKKEIKLW
jgi:hypothetical protein